VVSDKIRDKTRSALYVVLLAYLLIVAAIYGGYMLLDKADSIVSSLPASVRAEGERNVMDAAADAVRADTQVASDLANTVIASRRIGLALQWIGAASIVLIELALFGAGVWWLVERMRAKRLADVNIVHTKLDKTQ